MVCPQVHPGACTCTHCVGMAVPPASRRFRHDPLVEPGARATVASHRRITWMGARILSDTRLADMAAVVLRLRLLSGDQIDVTYEEPDAVDDEVINHVLATFAEDAGALHCTHGDRLIVVFGRGVAAVEVAPRGAVL
jgi:predicted NBD/HSP70 family sugar kinase